MGEELVSGEVRTHITFVDVCLSYMGKVHSPPQITIVTSKMSLITDHYNKCNNIGKVWNSRKITKMWHGDMKWANSVGEKWCW